MDKEEERLLDMLLKCSSTLLQKIIEYKDSQKNVRDIKLFMAHIGYSLLVFSGVSVVVEGDVFFISNLKEPIEDDKNG